MKWDIYFKIGMMLGEISSNQINANICWAKWVTLQHVLFRI